MSPEGRASAACEGSFEFVVNPCLGESTPDDIAALSRLLGEDELASPSCALAQGIQQFQEHIRTKTGSPGWLFFRDLCPLVCSWACDATWAAQPVPLLLRGQAASVSLPRGWVRCLMGNAFLLNIRWPERTGKIPWYSRTVDTFGKHSWKEVFLRRDCHVSTQKVLCLLSYFYWAARQLEAGVDSPDVVIERVQAQGGGGQGRSETEVHSVLGPARSASSESTTSFTGTWECWKESAAPLKSSMVHIHNNSMEDSLGRCFVDFANCFVGYTVMQPSATQEEILWCTVPEVQPASLLCESMLEGEAVVIRNVTRVSRYSGYLNRFKWEGFWQAPPSAGREASAPITEHDVLVIDACITPRNRPQLQFDPEVLARDLTKAWLGFSACGSSPRCTGTQQVEETTTVETPRPKETTLGSGGDRKGLSEGLRHQEARLPDAGTLEASEASSVPTLDPLVISTGNWGCGDFGGNPCLKFLQQFCAVAQVNLDRPAGREVKLDFSTFHNARQFELLGKLVDALGGATRAQSSACLSMPLRTKPRMDCVTVGSVCKWLEEFSQQGKDITEDSALAAWIRDKIDG